MAITSSRKPRPTPTAPAPQTRPPSPPGTPAAEPPERSAPSAGALSEGAYEAGTAKSDGSTTDAPPRTVTQPDTPERYAPFARTLTVFTLAAVLVSGQLYIVIPLLHDMATSWSATTSGLAWLVTAFAIGYGVGFLLFGPLSDRFGRRRLLMYGLPLAAVATAAVTLSPTPEAATALRLIQGVAVASFPPAALAYLAERVDPRRRAIAVSAVTAAFLASAVLLQVGAQLLVPLTGWRAPFLISAAGLALAAPAIALIMLPDTPRPGTGGSVLASYRALPGLLFHRTLLPRYLATLILMVGFVAVYTALQLYGVTSPAQLLALRAAGLPAIVLIPLLMPWLGRMPAPARAATFLAIGALSLAAVALTTPSITPLAVLLALYVAAIAGALPGLNEAISAAAGPARGSALALFSFALAAGSGVGPQMAAAFPAFTPLVYGVAATMTVAAVAVVISARRAVPLSSSPRPRSGRG
ncbi:MFS transporter [Nonomuraea typhae]|uniref:MFS transporter n=1 Tax=Nonomuraea typhae TaxID=2603600 RepID=UPI0012FB91D6|nr:MFS transporter [Nonomuraea typhae]